MEPKIIKEESVDKEVTSFVDGQGSIRTRNKTGPPKDRCKTPDSPEGARLSQPPSSPSQSSPTRNGNASGGGGPLSPLHNGSADSLTPPLISTPSSSLDQNIPSSNTQPSPSQYPLQYPNRPLAKLKRFLGTLVQFGQDIGTDIGEKVKNLVLSLVSSSVSVEEFHHSLQDVTNFPLRPFVLPFLRAHLPPLQREVLTLARAAKQTPLQYLRAHDHIILESTHSPSEPSEIFLSTGGETLSSAPVTTGANVGHAVKRRASDALYENGFTQSALPSLHDLTTNLGSNPSELNTPTVPKRPYNLLLSHPGLLNHVSHPHLFDYPQHNHLYSTPPVHRAEEVMDTNSRTSSRGDEEWRNIHVMLNCILSMVEKTKRALSILQQRNSQELTADWLRKQDVSADLKKAAGEIMAQAVRQTEDRVAEVKRKAEDAVNDVKRQAVVELQKAVAAAEIKANELVASERAKMEKMLIDARKQSEDTNSSNHVDSGENSQSPPVSSQPAPSQQNSCWNCGRKAHETCSGCSVARYCGPFCQHKDWENHHQVCCSRDKLRPQRTTTPLTSVAVLPTTSPAQDTARLKK